VAATHAAEGRGVEHLLSESAAEEFVVVVIDGPPHQVAHLVCLGVRGGTHLGDPILHFLLGKRFVVLQFEFQGVLVSSRHKVVGNPVLQAKKVGSEALVKMLALVLMRGLQLHQTELRNGFGHLHSQSTAVFSLHSRGARPLEGMQVVGSALEHLKVLHEEFLAMAFDAPDRVAGGVSVGLQGLSECAIEVA